MQPSQVREKALEFLRDSFLNKKLSFDKCRDLSSVIKVKINDKLNKEELLVEIKALDDSEKDLSPLVIKLLGDWK